MVTKLFFSQLHAGQPGVPARTVSNNDRLESCVQLLDLVALQQAEQRGHQLDKEIATLCQQAKRNKAQSLAHGFARDIQNSKQLSAFRLCNRTAVEPFTPMQQLMKRYFISNLRFIHVCDTFH